MCICMCIYVYVYIRVCICIVLEPSEEESRQPRRVERQVDVRCRQDAYAGTAYVCMYACVHVCMWGGRWTYAADRMPMRAPSNPL